MSEVQTSGGGAYTEATHTAYAKVSGAEPIEVGGNLFTPATITVYYDWRTQTGDTGWTANRISIAGPWCAKYRAGSGSLLLWPAIAPQWARDFAEANMPTSALVAAPCAANP